MCALENRFRVAIFDEFLDAFAKIPRAQQKKVNKFIRLFRENPTSSGINYESISDFSDQNLKTVRIDQAYRAIILKPEQGNVYVLLWVDHHDEAMAWAKHKRVAIHPETGALQVLAVKKGTALPSKPPEAEAAKIFDHIRDRELLRLGVPEELVSSLREVCSVDELDTLQELLPQEAYEALFFIAEGESLQEVEEAMATSAVQDVDINDFESALERDTSKRRFVVVDNDEALEAMLDAPLEKWRVFLHPSQRRLVNRSYNGPIRVLGGAGTGKTVVAMHRAAYLAEKIFNKPESRILFTTFTQNLAADIQSNLRKLCSADALNRIEVVHLDKWVTGLLKRSGYEYQIAYWKKDKKLRAAWDKAMALSSHDFSETFYREEWEIVVQAQGCEQWEDYKKASRAGRGVRLSRAQRKRIWPAFEEYRNQLQKGGLREPEDAFRDAAALLAEGKGQVRYDAVLVDEAQDMSTNAFTLIRKIVPEGPDDLFIVGDGHQRIYRRQVILGRAGINIRGRRGCRLRINYRTTDEIRRFAVSLLEGTVVDDLDGGEDTTSGYKSLMHGAPPTVKSHPDFESDVKTIAEWVKEGIPDQTCLVARTKKLRDKYGVALNEMGIETYAVKRSAAEDTSAPGLRIATMHRVKGLEFSRMIIAGVNEDLIPLKEALEQTEDKAIRDEREAWERALLYVAATRAKKDVLITSSGKRSSWLPTG